MLECKTCPQLLVQRGRGRPAYDFMSKIIHGHGFIPMSPERAKAHAEQRAKAGYVALYPQLTKK
jgi:hypothetical protein